MTVRNLDKLFNPQSVAVVGASNRVGSVGRVVMRNLLEGGFSGPIMPVNPNHQSIVGVLAYQDITMLPIVPDLGIVCTPPATVPGLIRDFGEKGTKAVIVLTAGLKGHVDASGKTLDQVMLETAHQYKMRLLGPNCLGLLVPEIGLNASFAHLPAKPGKIAFISQSGAMCTAVLDWARAHDIGFSHFISLGDSVEIDFGDVIDYLGSDPNTLEIMLYIESIKDRRGFMSAARASARNKPILVIKAGRAEEGAKAAASHTGALAGSDDVYDAAFRRAGLLRVQEIEELFAAAETVTRARSIKGERLAILTNGGGIGVMAVDNLIDYDGRLAELTDETIADLDKVLPDTWSRSNPVDIIGDAPGERYTQALQILGNAPEVDAVLVMHSPTAIISSVKVAEAIANQADSVSKTILTCWVGGEAVTPARQLFNKAGIPTYETPSQAIRAFMHIVDYRRNQHMLMETPPSVPSDFDTDSETVRGIIKSTLETTPSGMMSEADAKTVLASYGIPTVATFIVETPEEGAKKADEIGYPVAIKIHSPDITHKSDVGGVHLFLESAEAVKNAAETMLGSISASHPDARIDGFTVQKMVQHAGAWELILGVKTDPIFGPVIVFGEGGKAVEILGDSAIALPPLNMMLSRYMIRQTRIYNQLKGYRDVSPANLDAICMACVQLSQLVVDHPEISELDINPLLANEDGVIALDARIGVVPPPAGKEKRLSIRPYPGELEEYCVLRNGLKVLLRPIRPEDEPKHHEFISKLSPEDIRFRFFGLLKSIPHSQMARLTQLDYDREMAFIATTKNEDGNTETLGVVRVATDPDNENAEFAIVVRSDLKEQGMGTKLLEKMIDYCRQRGSKAIIGQILNDNRPMLELAKDMGFTISPQTGEDAVEVTLSLT